MAALSTLAAIATIGASAFSVASSVKASRQKPENPALPPIPEAPKPATKDKAAAASRRNAKASIPGVPAGRASTLLTGASGLVTPAPTERKTLLGL
jgi:hypothetical protein